MMNKDQFIKVMQMAGFKYEPNAIVVTLREREEFHTQGKLVNGTTEAAYFVTEGENFITVKGEGFKVFLDVSHLGVHNDEFGYYAFNGDFVRGYEPDSCLYILEGNYA